ncbi:hypothetical protein HCG51_26635 [Tolypothrix sp. PCC 7910]|uniref:hypothetical protein n=1 Tax=Tolypothrix sp. PCC 7910 TaxID=2099387 RepID=UPI00142775F7|nr:hypothetical protein [Tolypothrix sp. PCC 7910]QIR39932.1 hypothetical protein HCG51_26635 [Tolypothrix sp. PCC 7910]
MLNNETRITNLSAAKPIINTPMITRPTSEVNVSSLKEGIAIARPIDNVVVTERLSPVIDDFAVAPVAEDSTVKLRPMNEEYYRKRMSAKQLYVEIDPVPVLGRPLEVGDFWLFPDIEESRVFFSLATPRLLNVALVVQQVNQSGTIKITGGTAILNISAYAQADMNTLELYRQNWTQALANAGYYPGGNQPDPVPFPKPRPPRKFPPGETPPIIVKPLPQVELQAIPEKIKIIRSAWQFQPLNLRNLQAELNLPADHVVRSPEFTVSNDVGIVTFLIELSELGVQVWKDALEQRRGNTIPGVCNITANYYAQLNNRVDVKQGNSSISLGKLLANSGPEVVSIQNPKISLEAKLIIAGHPTIESVVVEWQPNIGGTPGKNIFTSEGGQLPIQVITDNVNFVEINWNAKVNFRVLDWPLIPDRGNLSFSSNNFADIIKPTAWIRNYDIVMMLLDEQGNVIPNNSATEQRVIVTLTFKSPYLQGVPSLNTTFETTSQKIVTVPLPVPNDQIPIELTLNVVAMRGNITQTTTRQLQINESSIIGTINPAAEIQIFTNLDTVSEASLASEMLGLLAMLSPVNS